MKGGPTKESAGFTIVETLIVLAVTGILFVSAVLLINGRQQRTQFNVAIRGLQQQFQQIVNEVSSGYYPNNGDFRCSRSNNGPVIANGGWFGNNQQGENGQCIFLGKVFYFGPGTFGPSKFFVFPIAANRTDGGGNEVTTLVEARPTAIAKGTTTNTNAPDDYSVISLQNGMTFAWGTTPTNVAADGTPNAFAIAIFSTLNGDVSTGQSGSRQFKIYGFNNADWTNPAPTSSGQIVDDINVATAPPKPTDKKFDASKGHFFDLSDGVVFCIASGTTNQSGLISIGGNGRQTSVDLDIKNGLTCGG